MATWFDFHSEDDFLSSSYSDASNEDVKFEPQMVSRDYAHVVRYRYWKKQKTLEKCVVGRQLQKAREAIYWSYHSIGILTFESMLCMYAMMMSRFIDGLRLQRQTVIQSFDVATTQSLVLVSRSRDHRTVNNTDMNGTTNTFGGNIWWSIPFYEWRIADKEDLQLNYYNCSRLYTRF
jgi:hypothetical protein